MDRLAKASSRLPVRDLDNRRYSGRRFDAGLPRQRSSSWLAVATWLVSGVSATDILRFLGYEIGFIAIPGAALFVGDPGESPGFLITIALGWPLGQTFEILAFTASAATGFRTLSLLYPVVAIVASGLVIWRRRNAMPNEHEDGYSAGPHCSWAAACALSLGLVYIGVHVPSSSAAAHVPDVGLRTRSISHSSWG